MRAMINYAEAVPRIRYDRDLWDRLRSASFVRFTAVVDAYTIYKQRVWRGGSETSAVPRTQQTVNYDLRSIMPRISSQRIA